MCTAIGTTHDKHMLFSIFIVEQSRDKLTVWRNWFTAYRTGTADTRFSDRIAMRTAAYMAKLIRYIHRTIYFAHQILSRQKRAVAHRTIYQQTSKSSLLLQRR